MIKPGRFLVLSGGASHGPDLWGAVTAFNDRYTSLGLAGASIGAVIVASEALGLSRRVVAAEFLALFQKNRLTGGAAVFRLHPRVLTASGGGLHDWSHVVTALKRIFGNRRMVDCLKPLIIVVSDVYTRRPVYIDSRLHPRVLIWEALAASTAVWPVADAQTIPSFGRGNRKYVDGGWSQNVPADAFSNHPEPSVVFYLESPDLDRDGSPDPIRTEGVMGVLAACLELALYSRPEVRSRPQDLVVPIHTQGSGFDFNLSQAEIVRRIANGRRMAEVGLT